MTDTHQSLQMDPADAERLIVETARRAREASRKLAVTGSAGKTRRPGAVGAGAGEGGGPGRAAHRQGRPAGAGGGGGRADRMGSRGAGWGRGGGLEVGGVGVPRGVIAIIYESRPDVTSDAAGLCLKAGNACILRGGTEAVRSSGAIAGILVQ